MNFITKKIEKIKSKKSLHEYGWEVKQFNLHPYGLVEYAQWMHPYEHPKIIDNDSVLFCQQFIKKGDLVIDIGAHTGDTALPMALCAGSEGIVLALEPNRYVYKILEQNSKLNKALTNIKPLNFAATDTEGTFTFNYSDASFCNGGFFQRIKNQKHGHKHTLEVEGKNLEKYLLANYAEQLPKLSFIKVDAEGFDKEILKSIYTIIKTYKPTIVSECNKHLIDEERFELFDILHSIGYSLKMTDNFQSLNNTAIEKKEDMLLWKHFDFIASPEEKH